MSIKRMSVVVILMLVSLTILGEARQAAGHHAHTSYLPPTSIHLAMQRARFAQGQNITHVHMYIAYNLSVGRW
jgi:hypothetical protein